MPNYCDHRIIQIETEPISETGKMGIYSAMSEDWFRASIADGVYEDEYQDETIKEFLDFLQSFGPYVEVGHDEEETWVVFNQGFQHSYFTGIYPQFEKALQALVENSSVEDFCDGKVNSLLLSLDSTVEDRFGTYIHTNENGNYPLNDFFRWHIEPDVKYYIGGTVCYHL